MVKKIVQKDCRKKIISTWYLPNSGERVALEVAKDRDGFDSPRFDFGNLSWETLTGSLGNYGGPIEDDQEFFRSVVVPQAKTMMEAYFYRRARLNTSITKLLAEKKRRMKVGATIRKEQQ